jgi:hypothetical protein
VELRLKITGCCRSAAPDDGGDRISNDQQLKASFKKTGVLRASSRGSPGPRFDSLFAQFRRMIEKREPTRGKHGQPINFYRWRHDLHVQPARPENAIPDYLDECQRRGI